MEMGFLAVPFFVMLLGAAEISYDLYVQAALDEAVENAARAVWTGQVAGQMTFQSFVNAAMCTTTTTLTSIGGLLDCSQIIATVEHVPSSQDLFTYPAKPYVTGTGPSATLAVSSWPAPCPGAPGTMNLIQAVYAGPTFLGSLIPNFIVTYNGQYVHPTYASVAVYIESNPGAYSSC